MWRAIRDLGEAHLAEIDRLVGTYFTDRESLEAVCCAKELLAKTREGDVAVLDVRPEEEYRAGHTSPARIRFLWSGLRLTWRRFRKTGRSSLTAAGLTARSPTRRWRFSGRTVTRQGGWPRVCRIVGRRACRSRRVRATDEVTMERGRNDRTSTRTARARRDPPPGTRSSPEVLSRETARLKVP